MKVLLLTDGLSPWVIGGIQQHSFMLVKYIAPLVDRLTVIHCGSPNCEPPSDHEIFMALDSPSNITIIGTLFNDKSTKKGHYLIASKEYSSKLYGLTKKKLSTYDMVYAQGFTGYAFLNKHKCLVSNLHGLNMFQKSFSLREKLEKLMLRSIAKTILLNSSYVISIGGELTNILYKIGVRRGGVISCPNAIEKDIILSKEIVTSKMRPRLYKHIKIIFIGRNDKTKGLHVLRLALETLETPVNLTIIGDVDCFDSGIHNIEFIGEVRSRKTIIEHIDKSHVLVSTSLSEGMPTVILEAMARGKAIIATDVGAVSELVDDSNGFLIKPDNIEAVRDAIKKLEPNDLEQLGKASISKVKNYTWSNLAKKSIVEFDKIL